MVYSRKYMQHALALAEQGRYTTSPHPMVGCVIVNDEKIVGEGYHQYFGGPHAEIIALSQANALAEGATCYVTLEPCSHYGKTPPCAEALVKAGIKKVVIPTKDDHELVNGQGIEYLKTHGIEVVENMMNKEARWLNRAFFKRVQHHKPWITAKLAITLDGKIADFEYKSKWISSPIARSKVQQLRAESDVIMVGSKTVLTDDPELSVREFDFILPENRPYFTPPKKIVIDSQKRIPADAKIFSSPGETFIYPSEQENIDIPALFENLSYQEINRVLVEGGGQLVAILLSHNLLDEIVLFQSGLIFGNQGISGFPLIDSISITDATRWHLHEVQKIGDDVMSQWVKI